MKFLKNRTVIGILCIVISLLIGFVAVPATNNLTNAVGTVVQAKAYIPKGELIREQDLQTVEILKKSIPKGAAGSIQEVAGKYAAVDITQEDIITPYKVSGAAELSDGFLLSLPSGKRAVSVTVKSFAGGLSGKLRAGDIVSVFSTVEENVQEKYEPSPDVIPATLPDELRYVQVAAVSDDLGAEVRKSADQANAEEEIPLPATVTLIVDEAQAKVLTGMERNHVHLAFVTRDAAQAATLLKEQEDFLKEAARLEEEKKMTDTGESTQSTTSEGTAVEGNKQQEESATGAHGTGKEAGI